MSTLSSTLHSLTLGQAVLLAHSTTQERGIVTAITDDQVTINLNVTGDCKGDSHVFKFNEWTVTSKHGITVIHDSPIVDWTRLVSTFHSSSPSSRRTNTNYCLNLSACS